MSAAKLAKLRRTLLHRIAGPELLSEALSALSSLSASVGRLGASKGGRPIYAVSVRRGAVRAPSVCGMRGDEPAPTNTSLPLLLDLLTDSLGDRGLWADDVPSSVTVHVVPVANPDGAELYYELSSRVDTAVVGQRVQQGEGEFAELRHQRGLDAPEAEGDEALPCSGHGAKPPRSPRPSRVLLQGQPPPLWPEDFTLTMTDAPYWGVHPEAKAVSSELLSFTGEPPLQ
ncbi:MAG: hypothetical protein DRJ56_06305 [Thermoprotei archaeon]|nr:MAG: hypothetical protein DRJ56_06305 [Thermoprotei archaeon]